MSTLSCIAIRPRDGLTVKDPRGFNVAGGVQARSVAWPLPPTVAGATRTAVGFARGYSAQPEGEEKELWRELLTRVRVKGPFPLHRNDLEAAWSPLWPAPRDAVALPGRRKDDVDLEWLAPAPAAGAVGSWRGSEAERNATESLWRAEILDPRKPVDLPRWWTANDFLPWLAFPGGSRLRERAPQPVRRLDMHVRVKPESYTAEDGMLFGHDTHEYLKASRTWDRNRDLKIDLDEIAIGLQIDCDAELTVPLGPWRMGGEARLVWAEAMGASEALAFPRDRFEKVGGGWRPSRRFRVVLCTPGCFAAGWRPDWLEPAQTNGEWVFRGIIPGTDLDVVLRSAMVDRPVIASGWDFARGKYGEPKPSQRLVAPGAVYFFELADPVRLLRLEDLERLWLQSFQTREEQVARDGFGLVVPGEWPSSDAS